MCEFYHSYIYILYNNICRIIRWGVWSVEIKYNLKQVENRNIRNDQPN